jgi:hypothetical protein
MEISEKSQIKIALMLMKTIVTVMSWGLRPMHTWALGSLQII